MTSYSVALSGSGFLFPVHCGAMEALSTLGTIDEVVGTSGGSLVSAAWIGTKGDFRKLEDAVYGTDFGFAMPIGPLSIWRLMTSGAASTQAGLRKWITKLAGVDWPAMPVTFLATDCKTFTTVPLTKRCGLTLSDAACASACIPLVYPPFKGTYQDGGILENLGSDLLTGKTKVAIRLMEGGSAMRDYSPINDALAAVGAMLNKIESLEVQLADDVTYIPVSVKGYSFMDSGLSKMQKEALWMMGYNAVMAKLGGKAA